MTNGSGGADAATVRPLPRGVVTFVMTDIEGSTQLFNRLGGSYVDVLAGHNALLRTAFERHRGVEVGTEGDSLFVAFADAHEALASCLDAQRALVEATWPPGVEVRVRMGVHTGDATPVGREYVALAVHQVARISAAAHGGQVLVSEATAEAVGAGLPPGASLKPMGSFQLRGFPSPVRLLQLQHPDLRSDFPPLRTLGVLAHNLPFMRTAFVGRAAERSELARLLGETGVVSVVGPGGVGKTRLALQVGSDVLDRFPDGVWLTELAPLTEPLSVARAVAAAVGVTESGGRAIEDLLVDALRAKVLLLVLDNCEHVLDAVAALAERLLRSCPSLAVLATSREPLGVDGEVVWRLEPMPTPDPDQIAAASDLGAEDSLQLFAARAALVRPGFALTPANAAVVARIVARVDGLPLAIELAAAALGERSLTGVLDGIGDQLTQLMGARRTAPARHQTLRAALEWSLNLLAPGERRLFVRLAAFAGTGSVEAAGAVCAGDPVDSSAVPGMLRRLVRSSLLEFDPESPERWRMLNSLRALAAAELARVGESGVLAERHRAWFTGRVTAVSPDIGRVGHAAVVDELAADHDNIRQALDDAVGVDDVASALQIAIGMAPFWTTHGDWTEGCERLTRVLVLGGGDARLRARAQAALGGLLLLRGELDEAKSAFATAHAGAAEAGDEATVARALVGTGYVAFRRSDLPQARADWEQGLRYAQRSGDERVEATVLRSLAIAAGSSGDQAQAEQLLDRAIQAARNGADEQQLRLLLGSAAEVQLWLGHYDRAEHMYGQALSIASTMGDLSARPLLLAELGWVALLRGEPATAHRLGVEAVELAEDLDSRRVLAHALRLTGEAAVVLGSLQDAPALLERALEVARTLDAPAEVAGVLCSQAWLALALRSYAQCRDLAAHAEGMRALHHTMRRVDPRWVLGTAELRLHDLPGAEERFREGLRLARRIGSPRHVANHDAGLGEVARAAGNLSLAAEHHGRALTVRARIGDRLGVAESLVRLALAATEVDIAASRRLMRAAEGIHDRVGAVPTPDERAIMDEAVEETGLAPGSTADDEPTALALAEQVVRMLAPGDSSGPHGT